MIVSRETKSALEEYQRLLLKWNKQLNLVAASTEADLWNRHIADSLQVFSIGPRTGLWADLGTGAGLPGLVVAIAAKQEAPDLKVVLVESDRRKASFCREVVRKLDLKAEIVAARIEEAEPLHADVVSARALAPLSKLLGYAERHLGQGGMAIFPKGRSWQSELQESLANWRFDVETLPSETNPESVILKIGDLRRV